MAMLKDLIATIVARCTNRGLTLLRNHTELDLSREEIRFSNISFSQFGEDLGICALAETFSDIAPVYVDVGCFHPIHNSNTLLLHKRGWRGVNIDLDEAKIAPFRRLRPNDINIVAACSDRVRPMLRLRYEAGVTDRLVEASAAEQRSLIGEAAIEQKMVETTTLDAILTAHSIGKIGFLDIDCEGHDLEVLKGLKLDFHRPDIIAVEVVKGRNPSAAEIAIHHYLTERGYERRRIYYHTEIYARRR
jgi:FkbM family methyltransferase